MTSMRAAPLNQTLNLPPSILPDDHCDLSGSWQAYAFLVEDCYAAIQQMYINDVMRHGDEMYEFTAQRGRRKTTYQQVYTPATYTVSKCSSEIGLIRCSVW